MPKTLINCPMLVSGCADRDSYDTQLLYFTCSSLSRDDKRIFLLSDRNGSPNVWVRELCTGEERMYTLTAPSTKDLAKPASVWTA